MIMLGKENPMVYTPEEIFNPTTANMVLQSMGAYANALRQDYKDALDKEEQFMKEYGSFTSPIAADQENYYNATLGGFGKLYDAAAQLGVDLLRSQEGRALILRYIMSRPYDELAKMKQSAQTADQYRTLLAKGVADGTLDYDTAVKLDGDLTKWDTMTNGQWTKVAPTSQKTINQVLAPYIEDLLKSGYEYDPVASKAKPGYRVKTVSDQKIKDQLNKNAVDIMKDPMMKLRAEQLGLTPEEFVSTQLYPHMRSLLSPQEEIDQYAKSAYEAKQNFYYTMKAKQADWAHEDKVAEQKQKWALEQINAKAKAKADASKGSTNTSSLHYNTYNIANQANGIQEVSINANERAKSNALVATRKYFKKYIGKDGKLPKSVLESKEYKKVYNKNYNIAIGNERIKSTRYRRNQESAIINNSKIKNSSSLGINVGEDEIEHLTGVQGYDYTNHTMRGDKNQEYTLSEVNDRRLGRSKGLKPGITRHKNKNEKGVDNFEVDYGNKRNFIQQTEPDGTLHWYLKLKNGNYYHLGQFDPEHGDVEYAGLDQRYLNDMKVKSKSVESALSGSDIQNLSQDETLQYIIENQ